jgi:hypothetical protein
MKKILRDLYLNGWFRVFLTAWALTFSLAGYRHYLHLREWEWAKYIARWQLENHDNYVKRINEDKAKGWDTSISENALTNYAKWQIESNRELERLEDSLPHLWLTLVAPPFLLSVFLWIRRGFKQRYE